jgi:hypothetical protein
MVRTRVDFAPHARGGRQRRRNRRAFVVERAVSVTLVAFVIRIARSAPLDSFNSVTKRAARS